MGWCSFAPIVDSWSGALVPPCGFFSELPKHFPCKAGGLIGTPLSTKKVLGWQVWLENADLFFVFFFFFSQKVPMPLIPVNHLND